MALSNAERQRKWMEKHRALHNFRRRKKKGGDAKCDLSMIQPNNMTQQGMKSGDAVPTVRSASAAKQSTLTALRALMSETVEQPIADSKKPVVFRNDYGAVISEAQWNKLQELKRRAKEGGYTIDEYSQ